MRTTNLNPDDPISEIPVCFLQPVMAEKNLALIRQHLAGAHVDDIISIVNASAARTGDPDMALNNMERFIGMLDEKDAFARQAAANPRLPHYLSMIFGASRFLTSFLFTLADGAITLLSDAEFLMASSDRDAMKRRLADHLADVADEQSLKRILRQFRKQEMLRIALRDLADIADLRETVAELSILAETTLDAAYAAMNRSLAQRYGRPIELTEAGSSIPARFAVIGMGKLGGGELNFSSDVDLMYVYSAEGETEGVAQPDGSVGNRITNHEYFTRLSEKISACIGEKTADGFVFRVDLRLRPEGQRGPIAQGLAGYELYYESWGQTWERSALIKARPVAGDERVGDELLERVRPFVYRKYLDFGAITEIRDMKQRINHDIEQKGQLHRNVKLGYGGIREIEFIIQALQLIYGGHDRSLRERSSLKALHLLSQKRLITWQEHDLLSRAYVFLRVVEHRIQILDDLQSQTMPVDPTELRALARRCGYCDDGREVELLLADYEMHTTAVRSLFDQLFSFVGEQSEGGGSGEYAALLDPEMTEQGACAMLTRFGFRNPEKAIRNLRLLKEGPAFVHQSPRGRRLFAEMFPPLFGEIVRSPDPDTALQQLESFLAAQGSWDVIKALLAFGDTAVTILIAVFANSEYLSRLLIGSPALLQGLIESRRASIHGLRASYDRELASMLERTADIPRRLDLLRRYKHQEEIRIGLSYFSGHVDASGVSRDLSRLAEACVAAAVRIAAEEASARIGGNGLADGIAVIAAGKLGGRELTYGSDLDIFFIADEQRSGCPERAAEYANRIAEKTISYLSALTREGFVFRVDTRLRPMGSKGPLVQSLASVREYYMQRAETWELQAMLRCRCVAGDQSIGREFCRAMHAVLYRERDQSVLARDVLSMRRRMEDELGRESPTSYNTKQGPGGIVDIEFMVQYFQLARGAHHARICQPNMRTALRAIHAAGLIEHDDGVELLSAHAFLRRLETTMRIASNQASSALPRDPDLLSLPARRMGYADGHALLAAYESHRARVRSILMKTLMTGQQKA